MSGVLFNNRARAFQTGSAVSYKLQRKAMAARNRAARVAVDVGFKMGDGVGAFWKHAYNTEPIATFSFALAVVGII